MSEIADRFIAALEDVERNGKLEPMLDLFDAEAVAYNPVYIDGLRGHDGLRRFWQEYKDFFVAVSSRFTRRLECPGVAVLEWVAEGKLQSEGNDFKYGGVTLLEHDGQKISQFNAYYDSGQLPPLQVDGHSTGLQAGKQPRANR